MADLYNTQGEHLARVSGAIERLIVAFCSARLKKSGGEFHMEDLRTHVRKAYPAAPDSAGRILRDLRQRGYIDYRVLNRRQSLYKVTWVKRDA